MASAAARVCSCQTIGKGVPLNGEDVAITPGLALGVVAPFGLASVWFSALISLPRHQRHLAGMLWYPLSM